ncbi:MAG: hypothetical protein PHU64_02060 [Candidatus Omnitrophica bacterium]|nr:hypothetical protein [Candidatus Omnitrophota bacterium]MDD5429598.1 hypothetical protein [Candidatus Omnitrophota bacterium]
MDILIFCKRIYKKAKKYLAKCVFQIKANMFNSIVTYWEKNGLELVYVNFAGKDSFKQAILSDSLQMFLFDKNHLYNIYVGEFRKYLKKSDYSTMKIDDDIFAFPNLHFWSLINFTTRSCLQRRHDKTYFAKGVCVENKGRVFIESKEAFGFKNASSQPVPSAQKLSNNTNPDKVIITTAYNFGFKQVGEICASRIRQYCGQYNINYIIFQAEKLTSRPYSWNKLLFMNYILDKYLKPDSNSWVMWIDADAVIVNNSFDLIKQVIKKVPVQTELVIAKSKSAVNAGVFLLRNSDFIRKLLKQWWSMEEYATHYWWEQKALISLMDENWENINDKVYFVPQNILNAYTYGVYGCVFPQGELNSESFIYHVPALPRRERIARMRKVLAKRCYRVNKKV